MKKVFDLTNKNIMLMPILILYSMFSGIFVTISLNGQFSNKIFTLLLVVLMSAAFISGWFNVIKNIIVDKGENEFLKTFPEGVGEYFLPVLGVLINIFIIFVLLISISGLVGMHFIGDPGINLESLSKAMMNTKELHSFVATLTTEQIIKINLWDFLILGFFGLGCLLTLLYWPVLFFTTKNPFKALFYSLKELFSKKFFKTLGLFFLIAFTHMFVSVISVIFGGNAVFGFITSFINFYIVTLISVGIFYYYHKEFIDKNLGQNIDVML